MQRFALAMALVLSGIAALAQPLTADAVSDTAAAAPRRLLTPYELAHVKQFYDLDDAARTPDQVYKLSLKGQKLKEIPQAVFRLKNLQVLDLSDNGLPEITPQIRELANLQVLNAYNNKLRVLPEAIGSLSQLHTLYVGRNRLVEVPAWVGGLGRLRILDVAYNSLTPEEIEALIVLIPKCKVTH